MTSNGDPVLNASASNSGTSNNHVAAKSTASPNSHSANSKPDDAASKGKPSPARNGDHTTSADDAQNESEAETVVLDPKDDDTRTEKKVIKTERTDDDDDASRLRSIKEASRTRSPLPNGRKNSIDSKDVKLNGAKHNSGRDAKSPLPASPPNRTTSRHVKEASPAGSTKSPVHSAHSPPLPTTRGRSSSTVESRKRKLRDDSAPKSLEPPRQKAKTEGLRDMRQPNSPATPGLGRPHKRSQSTQSLISGTAGRKRRDVTALAVSTERKNWSDSSSENSSSPRPTQTPNLPPHTRLKRSSHRALTSPARTMPHGRKVDRFGATRLARESEKGDLDAVRAAYDASPDELDQEDFAGIAPLQKAALHGWADVVEFLISKGCRTDCESNDRDTPLIDAVENGHLDVVKLLLNQGRVNPHHQNKKGQRAIDVLDHEDDDSEAIEKELRDAMRREIDITKNDEYAQPSAKVKSASRLLYNEYNVETLIEKAGDGDILAVGELINSNIKPNIACGVAAARGGHYDILSILLASGLKADPDPSKHPDTPMTVAIGRGHLRIVTLLLEQDNFDPTRRNKEGKAYYEVAEERRGPKWEQERDILKSAYDEFKTTHRSPRRAKKEPPNTSAIRMKRKSSPLLRERSSSPRVEGKRIHLAKSLSNASQAPQKSRRLLSGKEMASREVKRKKRVVEDESSDDESEEDVQPPRRKIHKPKSYSEGEEGKPVKKPVKGRADEHDAPKRRARSNDSEEEPPPKPATKIRTKTEKISSAKPTPEVESPDERKPTKTKIKHRTVEDKIKKRRLSDASTDTIKVKKTPTASAKSTPAPRERTATPEVERERRLEEQRKEAEAKRKALEAEARRKEEEAAAARKAAEEEEARKKAEAEAEAEAKRKAEEEARRKAEEEAEAARKREEEEARRRAEEEAERKRQEEIAARKLRVSKLPRALQRACDLGNNRPLHFSGEELGISAVFLPLFYAKSQDLSNPVASPGKSYLLSFQVVGILGLAELDLANLPSPYVDWPRIPVTRKQRDEFLRQYDIALLAQDFRFPMEGSPDFDYAKIQESIKEAKNQFLAMEGLYWIEDSVLYPEIEKVESLKPLLEDIKDHSKRRRIQICEMDSSEAVKEKKHKPRKSFMDTILAQKNGVTAVAATATVNGNG